MVRTSEGTPLPSADVYLFGEQHPFRLADAASSNLPHTVTDERGKFDLGIAPHEFTFIAIKCDSGIAFAKTLDLLHSPEIKIQAWGQVSGKAEMTPGIKGLHQVELVRLWNDPRSVGRAIDTTMKCELDPSGNFQFKNVVPGPSVLHLSVDPKFLNGFPFRGPQYCGSRLLIVGPGKAVVQDLNNKGQSVKGRVLLDPHAKTILFGTISHKPRGMPSIPATMQAPASDWNVLAARDEYFTRLLELPEFRSYYESQMRECVVFSPDGAFETAKLLDGDYKLSIFLLPVGRRLSETTPRLEKSFTIPASDGRMFLDLGTINPDE